MNIIELLEKAPIDLGLEDILQLQLYTIEIRQYCINVRNSTIDDCINRLGSRYGAAAKKDLMSLKTKSESERT